MKQDPRDAPSETPAPAEGGEARSSKLLSSTSQRFGRELNARLDQLEREFDALRTQLGELARGAA